MDNNYLNEEKYQKTNKKVNNTGKVLLIIGIIILVAGIVIQVVGFLGFGNTFTEGISTEINEIDNVKMAGGVFGSMGLIAIGGFMTILGIILTSTAGIVIAVGHRREITAYTTQQVIPVAKEGIDTIAPTVGNAAGEVAKGIKKGLKDEE